MRSRVQDKFRAELAATGRAEARTAREETDEERLREAMAALNFTQTAGAALCALSAIASLFMPSDLSG